MQNSAPCYLTLPTSLLLFLFLPLLFLFRLSEHYLSMHMTYISASFCMHGQLQQGLLCCSALLPNCFFFCRAWPFFLWLVFLCHVILQCKVFPFYAKALKYLWTQVLCLRPVAQAMKDLRFHLWRHSQANFFSCCCCTEAESRLVMAICGFKMARAVCSLLGLFIVIIAWNLSGFSALGRVLSVINMRWSSRVRLLSTSLSHFLSPSFSDVRPLFADT